MITARRTRLGETRKVVYFVLRPGRLTSN